MSRAGVFAEQGGVWEVRVPLATDLTVKPVEDDDSAQDRHRLNDRPVREPDGIADLPG